MKYLANKVLPILNVQVKFIEPNKYGEILLEDVMKVVDNKTDILSIIHSHNETGIVNDIESISKAVKSKYKNCLIHSDCV